jgi:hypothetical protein
LGLKYLANLSGTFTKASASGGAGFFLVMLGQTAIRLNRVNRAFWFADPAIDAFVGMDDEHVFAFVEAVHRTDLDAVRVLAANAALVDDVGH